MLGCEKNGFLCYCSRLFKTGRPYKCEWMHEFILRFKPSSKFLVRSSMMKIVHNDNDWCAIGVEWDSGYVHLTWSLRLHNGESNSNVVFLWLSESSKDCHHTPLNLRSCFWLLLRGASSEVGEAWLIFHISYQIKHHSSYTSFAFTFQNFISVQIVLATVGSWRSAFWTTFLFLDAVS